MSAFDELEEKFGEDNTFEVHRVEKNNRTGKDMYQKV
jgi:hypothetical protein